MPIRIEPTTRVFDLPSFTLGEVDQTKNLAYPYPPLVSTGESEPRSLELIQIENEWLLAEVAPSLGGRIVRLLDKRTDTDILMAPDQWQVVKRGPRRFELPGGIEIGVGPGYRPNTMGPVDVMTTDDSVIWQERVLGTGLSFHTFISTQEDRAELDLEIRAFNRDLRPQSYASWMSCGIEGTQGAHWAYDKTRKAGLVVVFEPSPLVRWAERQGSSAWGRFQEGVCEWLGPRQLDTWAVRLFPVSGLDRIDAASEFGALSTTGDGFQIVAFRKESGAKVFVLTEQNETLESRIDFDPSHPVQVSIKALAVQVRGSDGQNVLVWDRRSPDVVEPERDTLGSTTMAALRQAQLAGGNTREAKYFAGIDQFERGEDPTASLRAASIVPSLRAATETALGMAALQKQDWKRANRHFDDALLYNAEDHLLWWAKAMAIRLSGEESGEELPNAHYLAPLEPLLRMEAFLSQPISPDGAPTSLIATLKSDPEALVEGACRLIEAGLFEQAARWIDEALRQRDEPRLHYLMGYCHLERSKMTFEAAQHVMAVESFPIQPPYPWQRVEWSALERLSDAFPDSQRLKKLIEVPHSETRL
jgi:tetratricopeptide (TPR) repeat protein